MSDIIIARSEDYIFRRINADEADKVAEIEAICFPPSEACTPAIMKERVRLAADSFLVLVDGQTDEIIGFINGLCSNENVLEDKFYTETSLHDPKGENVLICGVDVLPAYRGRGLARAMMAEFIKWQKEQGHKKIMLTCVPGKVSMYQKFGFVDRGESESEWGGELWHAMDQMI